MDILQFFEDTYKTTDWIIKISYAIITLSIPLLFLNAFYIVFILAAVALSYYCRKLPKDLGDFEERVYKGMNYVAEDMLEDVLSDIKIIFFLGISLGIVTILAMFSALKINAAALYLILLIGLCFVLSFMCKSIDFKSAFNEQDKQHDEYKPEEQELKLPKERPIRKV